MKKTMFVVSIVAFVSVSCSVQKIAVRQTAQLMRQAAPAFEEESDLILAESAMAANLKMLDGLLKVDPTNPDLLLLLSQGFGGYAFSFLEDKMEEFSAHPSTSESFKKRAADFYTRGFHYATRYLEAQNESFVQYKTKGLLSDFEESLKAFDKEDVPYLFWAGYNWGNLINLSKDDPAVVADLGRAESLMKRVLELEETYYYGSAHLFLGVFYGSRPAMLGGNLGKSKEHFDKALKISNKKLLLVPYMYARFYCVQSQDEKLFGELLRYVINAPAQILHEQSLANQVAKIRAYRALRGKNEFF
ncbi:MAG: hypothetical protein HYS98_08590 [Deltaproteobacteria bacterium]|nr:hypothetical protein [Deltaproteobacteria bacterium]